MYYPVLLALIIIFDIEYSKFEHYEIIRSFLALICTLCAITAQEAESYFEPLKYRNIGPFRGGRSVGSVGVVNDPLTYYMGTTGGGLWKTEDAGQRWYNISDGF